MASSSATIIDKPDGVSLAPGAGQLFIAGNTLGVVVRQPGGPQLVWTEGDVQGANNAPALLEQNGLLQSFGGEEATLSTRALQYRGVFTFLSSAGQVLPAPDFTINQSTGATSFGRVSCAVDCLDWVGGIAPPKMPGGAGPFGAIVRLLNISSGGQIINVLDPTVGGSMRGPGPSIRWGFNEFLEFTWDNFGWCLNARGPGYYYAGGAGPIGRSTKTASTAAKKLLFWAKSAAATYGMGVVGDVTATDVSGGAQVTYFDVKFCYDAANALYMSSGAGPRVGDFAANGAAVALGFTGAELSLGDDASNHNLIVTPPTATPLTWSALNFRQSPGSQT